MRDKYAEDPPPDHIRYTGGVPPAPKMVCAHSADSCICMDNWQCTYGARTHSPHSHARVSDLDGFAGARDCLQVLLHLEDSQK